MKTPKLSLGKPCCSAMFPSKTPVVESQSMKPNQNLFTRGGTLASLAIAAILLGAAVPARADINWDGDNAAGNFSYCDNWYGDSCPSFPWNSSYGNLVFNYRNNGSQTSLYYDLGWPGSGNIGDIIWETTFGAAVPINGSGGGINFNQRVENRSSFAQTLNIPLSGAKGGATQIELNPVNGDLVLNGNIYNDNNVPFHVFGVNSKMLTIGVGLTGNASVSLNIDQYSKVKLTAAQAWGDGTHGVVINQGEFWMDSGGSLASATVPITVGQNDANVGKLWLSVATGGQTLSNPITLNNQSGSPAEKTIGGLNTSGTNTFNSGITLNGQANLSAGTGGAVIFAGPISGAQNVVVNGYGLPLSGVIQFAGTNTYTGNTYISGGTLQFNTTGYASNSPNFYLGEITGSQTATLALGSVTGGQVFTNTIPVRSGSSGTKTISSLATSGNNTLAGNIALSDNLVLNSASGGNLALSGIISGNGFGITNVGSGTTTLSGVNTYSGATTISAGTLTIGGAGQLGSGTYSANITNNAAFSYASSASQTLSGIISGTGTLTNFGSGTLTLSGVNTYSGATTVAGGTLKLGNVSALGTTVAGTTVNSGATLDLNGLLLGATNEAVTISGTGVGGVAGAITNSSTTKAVIKNVTLAADTTLSPSGSAAISIGSSTGQDGTMNLNGFTLTKSGSGTLVLNGVNMTGAGNLTVNQGTLQLMEDYNSANYPQQAITLAGSGNLTVNAGATVTTYRWGPGFTVSMPIVLNGGSFGSGWPGPNGATIASPITVTADSTFNFNGGYDNVTLSGNITGSSGLTFAGGNGGKKLTGTNSYGATTINSGVVLQIGNAGTTGTLGYGNVTNNGTLTFNRSDSPTVTNNISGTGTTTQSGAGVLTLAGSISGTGAVTVSGVGALTLNGTNTYSGATTVSSSELVGTTSGSCSNSAVTVASGATNGVQVLSTGGQWTCASLTCGAAGQITFMDFNFGATTPSTTTAPLQVNGNLALTARVGFIVRGSAISATGTYPLVKYTGTLSGTVPPAAWSLPAGMIATLNNNTGNKSIDLVVTALSYNNAIWAVNGGNWDINTSLNWTNSSGLTTNYQEGNNVLFNTPGANSTVTLNTTVNPAGINGGLSFNNSGFNYTVSGSGAISGSVGLVKSGTSELTLATANTFSGGVVLNGGTVRASTSDTALGSGAVTVLGSSALATASGGGARSLANAISINLSQTLSLDSSNADLTLSGVVGGSGALTKTSIGTVLLNGANNFTGASTINGGILQVGNGANTTATLGNSSAAIINSGATLTYYHNGSVNPGNAFSGAGTLTYQGAGSNTDYGPSGANTMTGPIVINGARLKIDNVTDVGTASSITVLSGGSAYISAAIGRPFIISGLGWSEATGNLGAMRIQGVAISNSITLAASSRITSYSGNATITGPISETGAAQNLEFGPNQNNTQIITLSGTNNYSGNTTINTAALTIGGAGVLGNGSYSSNLIFMGTSPILNYNSSLPQTFSGVISGTGTLTQQGAGTLTLSGVNTFTGATTISAGKLVVVTGGSATNSDVTVASGATLGVKLLTSGGSWGFKTLTLNSGTTTAAFDFSAAAPSTTIAPLQLTNTLVNNGTLNVTVSGAFATGVYPLIKYFGTLTVGTLGTVTLPGGAVGTLVNNTANKSIDLNVTTANAALVWNGGSGNWDINTTANWTGGLKYLDGNAVTFDDTSTGTAPFLVTNGTTVNPALITVNNPTKSYTFTNSGAGLIAGGTALVKSGAGTLTLGSTAVNTFTGGTTIGGGTLALGTGGTGANTSSSGALGTGLVTINTGGTLKFWIQNSTSFTIANALYINGGTLLGQDGNYHLAGGLSVGSSGATLQDVYGGKDLYFDTPITGAGAVTMSGSEFYFNAANTYSGDTTISSGTLYFGNALALQNSTLSFSSGAVNYNGQTSLTFGGLKGSTTLALPSGTLTVGNNGQSTVYSGILTGSGILTKIGAGTLILSGANTFSGKTAITGGTLQIGVDSGLGNAPGSAVSDQLTINGATLVVTNNATLAANRGVTIGSSGATIDTSSQGTGNTTTLSGLITGTGAFTLKANGDMSASGGGAGGLGIKLNNTGNNFNSDVTITAGLVSYAADSAFGATANKIILNGGGLLDNNVSLALSRAIQVNSGGGTFRCYGSSSPTWSGAITGSGNLNRTDGGTLTLAGSLSAFSGSYSNLSGATVLTGTASTIGGNWNIAASTLTVNSTASQSLAGVISGTGAFVKNGIGTLTLSAVNTYSGATTISGGELVGVAGGSSLNSAVTVANGATNGVQLATLGTQWTCKGLTYGATGSDVTYADFNCAVWTPGSVAPLQVNGNLVNNGTLNVIARGGTLAVGTYPLIKYTGTLTVGTLGTVIAPAGVTATLVNNTANKSIDLTVTADTAITGLAWAVGNGTWDTSTANWTNGLAGGALTAFANGNQAFLDDTASGASPIALAVNSTLYPTNVTANLTNKNFTISGTGAISGPGSLTKNGSGILSIGANQSYTGGTAINGGILDLTGGGGSSGTIRGTIFVNSGGTLRLSAGDATGYSGGGSSLNIINLVGGTLNINTTANQTLGSATVNMTGGVITGVSGGNLDFFGGATTFNTLASPASSTISGVPLSPLRQGSTTFNVTSAATNGIDLDISSVLRTSPSGDAAGAVLFKAGAGTMRISAVNSFARDITVSAGSLILGGAGQLNSGTFNNNITNNGGFTFGSSASQTVGGVLAGSGYWTNSGTGILTLTATNIFTGPLSISAGTVVVGGSGSLGNGIYATNLLNNGALNFATSTNQILAGIISGTGSLIKSGSGILTNSGVNTYTGTNLISGGIFVGGNANALGAQSATSALANDVTIQSGATLDINGSASATPGFWYGLTMAGTGTSGQGALINNGASGATSQRQTPNITLSSNATIGGSGDIYMINNGYAADTLTMGGNTLTKIGANNFILCNTTVSGGGTIAINNGTVSQYNTASSASGTAFSLANTAGVALNLNNLNLSIGSLTGGGATGGNVTLGSSLLTVGGDNTSPAAFAGVISGTTGGLTKTGTGTLTLSGTNTYSGATTVSAGTLALSGSGSISNTPTITVAAAGLLDVSALTSPFVLGSAQTLTAGNAGTAVTNINGSYTSAGTNNIAGTGTSGTLIVNGGLSLTGGALFYDLIAPANADLISLTGASRTLSLSGTTTVILPSLPPVSGTYTLINGISSVTSGTAANLALNASVATNTMRNPTASFTVSAPTVTLTIASGGTNLFWQGAAANGLWDVNTTVNWTNSPGGTSDKFFNQDTVTFNDTAVNANVTNNSTVYPGSVTFNNTSKAYILYGSGSIAGGGTLTKSGSGALTLTGANTYSGATTVNAGTLYLNSANALMSSIQVNGTATLRYDLSGATGTKNLTTGSVTMNSGTTLNLEQTESGGYQSVTIHNIGSGLTVNGATLTEGGSTGALFQRLVTPTITLIGANTFKQQYGGYGHYFSIEGTTTGTGTLALSRQTPSSSGTSTLNLKGDMSGYSGNITISTGGDALGGTVIFGNATGWGSGTLSLTGANSDVLIGDRAATAYNGLWTGGSALGFQTGTLSPAGLITVGSGALLQVENEAGRAILVQTTGGLAVNGGTVSALGTAGTSAFVPNGTWTFGGSALSTVSANVQLNNASTIFSVADAVAGVDTAIFGSISGNNGFTKTGAGTLLLAGANTYAGSTTISAGAVVASSLTNVDGATLSLVDVAGTLAATNLALGVSTGSTVAITSFTGATSAPIVVTNLVANGTVTVVVTNTVALNIPVGQWPLIKYTGSIGGVGFGSFTLAPLPRGVVAVLVNNTGNNSVDLNVLANDQITWNGNVAGGIWDTNNTANWTWNGSATTYQQTNVPGDGVLFDDTATGTTNVVLNQIVSPLVVVFNNTNKIYTLSGTGAISGTNSLIKNGPGYVTLANANSYSGTTFVNGGVLMVQNRSGDAPYTIGQNGLLKIGYNTGGGYAATAMTITGNGVASTNGFYLQGGKNYNCSGQIQLVTAPTTIRQYGTGLASLGMFDVNGDGIVCKAAASGSVIDSNIQMVSDGYGMSVNIESGVNTATGDLIINGPLNAGTLGFNKRGTGSVALNGVAASGNAAVQIQGGTVICGITNCLGVNAAVPISGGAKLALNGFNQTIASLTGSGSVIGGATISTLTITNTTPDTNACVLGGTSVNQNNLSLTVSGTSTLLLAAANTYTGNTTISAGTLALGATGSISNTPNINLAAGATFDVSAISAYVLSSSNKLSAAGTATAATINGASGGTVSLGSQPVTLTYDGTHPALTVSQGTLVLNGNAFTVNRGSPLALGSYNIVSAGSAITSSGVYSVTGTAIPAGSVGVVSVSGNNVVLTIGATTLSLISSATPSGYNDTLTFTTVVQTNGQTAGAATGYVLFETNSVIISSNSIVSGGTVSSDAISSLPRGTNLITAIYSGDANYQGSSAVLNQVVTNHPPTASVMTVTRTAGTRVHIFLTDVATNWSDVDIDPVTLAGVNLVTTNGMNVLTNSSQILYTNSTNVADQISYTITDGQGGMTTGYINIVMAGAVTGTNSIANINIGGSTNTVTAYGIPGYSYILERATNLVPAIWVDVSTNTAATNGVINAMDSFDDLGSVPPGSAYYRLKWQP